MIINIYYPGEPVNIHIQSSINIILENNWVITTKKGKGKLPLFCGNGERVIPIHGVGGILNGGRVIYLLREVHAGYDSR